MSVTINGDTGIDKITDGSVVAADIGAGEVTQAKLASGVAGTGPAFSAYLSATQSISSSTYTKVAIDTENFDTASCFDTSTSRFTPNVAGYYQVNGIIRSVTTSQTHFIVVFYKNGSQITVGVQNRDATSVSNQYSISDLIYMNGTTDYLELYGYIVGTSPTFDTLSPTNTSMFSAFIARAA